MLRYAACRVSYDLYGPNEYVSETSTELMKFRTTLNKRMEFTRKLCDLLLKQQLLPLC